MFDIIEKYLAQIAQLVEQRTENPCVTGSIPVLGIIFLLMAKKDGLLAQAVEHLTFNQGVAGSSPAWLSKNEGFKGFLGVFFVSFKFMTETCICGVFLVY